MRRHLPTGLSLALGFALSLGAFSAASAGPAAFTWNPSATGNTTAGTFTADQFGISDFSTINVPTNPSPPGSVSESGFIEITGFTLAGTPMSTVHVTGAGGYGIYEAFSATSHLSACSTGLCGAFDSFTANVFLYSTVNGLASYAFPSRGSNPAIHLPAGANPVLLATKSGPAAGSPNVSEITRGVPSESIDKFWTDVFSGGFFIDPPLGVGLDFDQAYTATAANVVLSGPGCATTGTDCSYQIKGAIGSSSPAAVPEPASLMLLAFGLAPLGAIRHRG